MSHCSWCPSALPSLSEPLEVSRPSYLFSWICLFCAETMVSVSCSVNVAPQLSVKSSRKRGSSQRLSSFLLFFALYPGRTGVLQPLAHCSDLRGIQCLHLPWRTGLWSVPLSGALGSTSLDSAFFSCVSGNICGF